MLEKLLPYIVALAVFHPPILSPPQPAKGHSEAGLGYIAPSQLETLPEPSEQPKQTLSVVTEAVTASQPSPAPVSTGSHEDWMRAAGISPADFVYVDYIVSRESGWNPCSYYPSQSNCNANPIHACGLVMQNPCHKIPGDWRDPVAALVWMKGYVSKYGGFAGAYTYWLVHHNY